MSERESQPGLGGGEGASSGDDLRSLELPSELAAGLRREFRTTDPVPAHVDLAVLAAFEERRSVLAGRRGVLRFAAVAASVAAVIWVGSATWPSSKTASNPTDRLAISNGYGAGNLAGGVGAVLSERGKADRHATAGLEAGTGGVAVTDGNGPLSTFDAAASKNSPNTSLAVAPPAAAPAAPAGDGPSGSVSATGRPVELAMVDADGNGRVNILDAMRMAKTVEAVRLVRAYRDKADAAGEAGEAMNKARMAFFVESLDVTWDLTADGVVDQKDADLLAARIVSVGKGGV